jgi:glycosyltransferase involved in cell wall biosynthesis
VNSTNEPPTVSAVVATRDRLELLARAVRAIVAQEYAGTIETVVVMDGGPPPSELVSERSDRPLRIICNARTPGLAGARNTGIQAATGDLVAFCDDDDVWHRDKISEQVLALDRHPAALLAVTGMTVVREGHRIDRIHPAERIPLHEFVLSRVQEAHPSSFLWRREAFDEIGLVDEELPGSYGEDWDLLLRAARIADVVNVPSSLLDVHWHPGSFFADRWSTIVEAIDRGLEKHPEIAASPRGHARQLGRRAFAQAASGDRRGAVGTARRALGRWPGDRRAWVALAVAGRAVSAERAQRLANAVGRGI